MITGLSRYMIFMVFPVLPQFNDANIGWPSRYDFYGIPFNLKIPILGDHWYYSISRFNFNLMVPYWGTSEIRFYVIYCFVPLKTFCPSRDEFVSLSCLMTSMSRMTMLCLRRRICIPKDYIVSQEMNLRIERLFWASGDRFMP